MDFKEITKSPLALGAILVVLILLMCKMRMKEGAAGLPSMPPSYAEAPVLQYLPADKNYWDKALKGALPLSQTPSIKEVSQVKYGNDMLAGKLYLQNMPGHLKRYFVKHLNGSVELAATRPANTADLPKGFHLPNGLVVM